MKKRILSALLTLGMVLTMLPVSVFATDYDNDGDEDVAYADGTYYSTLDAAIEEVAEGATIELLQDCEITEGFNKTLTFTGGHKISINQQITNEGLQWMNYNHVLTLDGVEVEWNSDGSDTWLILSLGGTLNVTNGAKLTFQFDSKDSGSRNAVYMNANSAINVTNGSTFQILGYNTAGSTGQGIQLDSAGRANINVSGKSTFLIDGTNRGYVNSPSIYVEDSTFTIRNCTSNASNGGNFTAIDSTVTYENNSGHGLSAGNVTIQNSTFNCNKNAYYGITYSGNMTMDGTSVINANENGYGYTGGGLQAYGVSTVETGAEINILDNERNGMENYGTFTIAEDAKFTVTGNNEPSTNGGGIYNGGTLTLPSSAIIMNNYAEQTGGGICNAGTVTIPSGVQLYNNHAGTAGDDIYNRDGATINFAEVGSGWELDDCGHAIDGWYDDSEGSRWGADTEPYHAVEFTAFEALNGMTTVTGLTALKAAHGVEPIDPGEVPEDTWETSKSKTATNLDADYQSQVTLSLPASEEELVSDVVFVLDKSKSAEVADKAIQMLEDLNEQIADTGATVKVGVVIFNKEAHNVLDLTELNDETIKDIVEAIQTKISDGTNTHAGLLAGEAMLDADTSVDANRKYLIFVSDGITYMYNEEPTATAWSFNMPNATGDWHGSGSWGTFAGPDNWYSKYHTNDAPSEGWDSWMVDIAGKIAAQSETYEYPYNGTIKEATPEDIDNWDTAYAMSIDKALYLTYQTYQEIAAKYHCYSMVGGSNAASSHPWATSFMTYLSNGKNVTFDEIQKDIYYLLDEGSSVKDVIGYGEDYNFDFINSLDALTLTVGGEELDKEELIDPSYTDPYVTSAYGFGAKSDGTNRTYQFVLNYYEKGEDGQSDECFVWEINVPVSNFAPVQLTYTVQLTNPKTESGTYGTYDADGSEGYDGLYTNNEATLYPVDSNGVPGQAENFYRPTVSYTVGTVSITPADITIYTGGDGYDSVVNGSGNEIGTTNNGLPTPGFYIELPAEVNNWLIGQAAEEDKVINDEGDVVVDLSKYLTFTYDDGQGNTRTWHLERYDKKQGNDSMAYNRYIYRILPAEVNGEKIPIRLQFTDDDGTFMTSDDFTVSLDDLFHEYDMTIYAGDLNQKLVKAVLTVNDAETEYDATVESGELTVRGVTDNDTHYTTVEDSVPENVTSVTAQVGADAKFYINGSQLEVINPDDVKLLVDSLVPDQNNTLVNSALDEFDAIPNDYDYEARYLDLVDTSNGNAYVTTDDAVVVYWAYPEGTDENTEFHLVHYVGLDRNDNNDLTSGTYTMEYYSEENGNLETTKQGIRFTVNSFSPFTLFWEDDSNNGGGGGGGGSKPELNKEDHIAYVSGYPDGTVQPEGYITREEVATIFFRLLTDESRADFITDYNPYPDVASDRWSYYAITTMTNGNLMLGRTGGVFDPGANITRAEFAVVAAQFSNAQYSGPDKFTDISDHWARDYINRAANEGWIAGYPDGTFGPDRFITRAEVMALVNEVLERAPDADYMLDNMTVWPDNPKSAWYYEDVQEATNSHSYVWRNTQHTSEDWEDFISMRTFNELVRDAFNAAN